MQTTPRPPRQSPLGNGREEFTGEDDLPYDPDDAPESQGRFADERTAQGSDDDEDDDPSDRLRDDGPLAGDASSVETLGEAAPSSDTLLRPDDGIEEEVRERFAEELELDPVDVVVDVSDGVVVLRGVVQTLELRDAAGECAALVSGVRRIENELTVRDASDPATPA